MAHRALLGRTRELAHLETALDQAVAGRGSVFLLSGEPGIGKTRLAEEGAELARRRGAVVFWGRAWEVEGAPACWPWIQVLAACPPAATVDDADLAPLRSAGPPPPGPEDPEAQSIRLGAAIVTLLRRLSGLKPVVLVFDDLHASDLASLTLLRHVARELRGMRVLVIGTYREIEARRSPTVSALLGRLARDGTAWPLGRLDRAAVERWVKDSVAGAPAPALVSAVFAATEGNPLFVEAVAHLLVSRGYGAELPPGFVLPDTIRETLHELLARVSADTRAVLEAASVLGRECPLTTLQAVSEGSIEDVLHAIGDGVGAGVLAAPALPSSPVRFAHSLTREALYQGMPASRRIELHARCARAIRRLHATDLDAHLAELAHHLFESAPLGSWLEAAELASRAGHRAAELLAFDDAARHFERALTALDRAEPDDDARRAELMWRLGAAQIQGGQPRIGREQCERSAALAERTGRPDILARAALAAGLELVPGRVDNRLAELLEVALRLGVGDEALRAQLLARLAAAMMPTLSPERPLALARDAIALARTLGDRRVLAQVLSTARSVMTPANDLEERAGLDLELASLAANLGDPLLEVQARGRLVLDAIEGADADAARRELAIQQELADRIRVPRHQLRAACTRLLWASLTERADDFEHAEAQVRALAEQLEDTRALLCLEANRQMRAELRGDVAEAGASSAALEDLMAREPSMAWWLPHRRAATLAEQGRLEECRATLRQLAPEGPVTGYAAMGPSMLAMAAPTCIRLGDREWMQSVYEMMLPFAARVSLNMALLASSGPVAFTLGRLSAALGRREEAAAHFRAAMAVCARGGFTGFDRRIRVALEELGRPAAAAVSPPPPRLERDGELWILRHDGREVRLRDSKGLHYLDALLRAPSRELHVGELIRLVASPDPTAVSSGDAGELLDARAKAEYRRRLELLDDALEDAEERGDRDGLARIRHEREALADELARAVGLGGRDRRAGSASERARINVQRRIRDVLTRVAALDASLGRHLELHVKTGVFCSWEP